MYGGSLKLKGTSTPYAAIAIYMSMERPKTLCILVLSGDMEIPLGSKVPAPPMQQFCIDMAFCITPY